MKVVNNTRRRGRKYYQDSSRIRTEPKADILNKKFEKSDKILVIACGALAKEITALIQMNNWTHLQLRYLPAKFHNEPKNIPQNIRKYLVNAQNKFSRIFIVNLIIWWKNSVCNVCREHIAMNFFPALRPSVKCLKKNLEVFS
jgi:hypothetical protein